MRQIKTLRILATATVALFLIVGCTSIENPPIANDLQQYNYTCAAYISDGVATDENTSSDLISTIIVGDGLCYICGEHYTHEFWRLPAPPFQIKEFIRPMPYIFEKDFLGNYPFRNKEEQQSAVSEFLSDFETVHTITYIHPMLPQYWEYDTVILWSNEFLRDVSIMVIGTNDVFDSDERLGLPYGHTEVLFTIDELAPGDAIALNLKFNAFERPSAGLVFTDEEGVQRRMWMSYGAHRFCHARYHLRLYDETPWVNIAWD